MMMMNRDTAGKCQGIYAVFNLFLCVLEICYIKLGT